MVARFERLMFWQVYKAGSFVPGPPRQPTTIPIPGAGGGDGLIDATSNSSLVADWACIRPHPSDSARKVRTIQAQPPLGTRPSACSTGGSLRLLVPELGGYVPLLVHLAKRALVDYLWRASAQPQNFVRHHPRLDQDIRVLNGHLVKNLIAFPRQLLDSVHVGGMKQATASEPGCKIGR